MANNAIDIEFVSLDDALLAPYAHESVKNTCKLNVGKKLKNIFAKHKSPPIPENVERLAVFGSRSIGGARVLAIIDHYVLALGASLIVTAAEPSGVCRTAQEYARSRSLPLQVHFLNIEKYARGAHEHRSDHVILASNLVLLIYDGKSKGTYNEVLRTIKFKKPFIYKLLPLVSRNSLLCEI